MRREFERTSMVYGDRRTAAVKTVCGKCGHEECHPRGSTKTNVGADEEAQRFEAMFTRAGWWIGKRQQEDRCPKCAKELGIERPKRAPEPRNTVMREKLMEAVNNHDKAKPPAAPKLTTSTAPREMSREDGRIVFAKIEDVYRDEKHGYQNGWSDQRVAEDLNVPRAWVEQVRKQFFGPEGGNEEIRELLTQGKAIIEEHKWLKERFDTDLSSLANRAEMIQRRLDHIEKQVGR